MDLIKKFECPICGELYNKPIYMCSTGHSLCAKCKPKAQKCPSCCKAISNTRNFALENVMEMMQAPCKNKPCPAFIALDQYKQHSNICKYRTITCKFLMCTWKGKSDIIYDHIRTVHSPYVVGKGAEIQPHQRGQCFIAHDEKMIYIRRCSQQNFVTWSGESTALIENFKANLVIEVSKSNQIKSLMSHPIVGYREENLDSLKYLAVNGSIVWLLANKLMDSNIKFSIV